MSISQKTYYAWQRAGYFWSVNWLKTLYFNFKKFPFSTAAKLPVMFFGRVRFQDIGGEIIINGPISKGMVGFGKRFEKFTRSNGTAEIAIEGRMIFNGPALFGKDYLICVGKGATLEIGSRSGIGSRGKIVCLENIKLGDDVRISYECQVMDSNFHQMIDTLTGEKFPMNQAVVIGNKNFVGNRTTILPGTKTPGFCTIASNSVANKDYTSLGNNILIGGVPCKLLRQNISRDWEGERNDGIWRG